jgi:hypothetical protein
VRFGAGKRGVHLVSVLAKNLRQGLAQIGVIFDNEHCGFIHGSTPSITDYKKLAKRFFLVSGFYESPG